MARAILFASDIDDPEPWREAIAARFPELDFRVWPSLGRTEEIRYALVWKIAGGVLRTLPELRAIFALGAGVDQILIDPEFPRQVPLARLVGAGLAEQMSEYVLLGTLYFHRQLDAYLAQQRRCEWRKLAAVAPGGRRVGIMGLGVLGSDAARKLATMGFKVSGWSRTPKSLPGVASFAGEAERAAFLARCEILVNLLPLTAATRGILARPLFDLLPDGAALIHAGRGRQLVERDLVAALDRGKLVGAMLDVFAEEPLPPDHPFWRHPKVIVTPHASTQPIAGLALDQVVENIRRIEAGETPIGLVDPEIGY